MNTLRSRVIVFVLGIVVLTTAVIGVTVHYMAGRSLEATLEENALNLMEATRNNVESQYNSILYNKKAILDRRKSELKSAIEMAYSIVELYYERYRNGELSESVARQQAFEDIEHLRYDGGVGYFWVNNVDRAFPTLLMHPTMPELVGRNLLIPEYNCVTGTSQNLFHAFIDRCEHQGEGFVDYSWPKPTADGLTEQQPKVSFVKQFTPWGFIIGTGVYIDDIEKEASKRLDAVIAELRVAMARQRIGDAGYFFIFNENNFMLVHPNLANQNFGTQRDVETGRLIGEEIKRAAHTPSKSMEYLWDKPADPGNYSFRKKIFVTYFRPLGWYIAVSVYKEDFGKRVTTLTSVIVWLSLLFIGASVPLAFWLARSFSKPIRLLTRSVQNVAADGLPAAIMPAGGTTEIVTLSSTINQMVDAIRTSRRRALDSETRFRTIFESVGEPIWLIRIEDGAIAEFNAAAHQILEYTRPEFAKLPISAIVVHEDADVLKRYTGELADGETLRFESLHLDSHHEIHEVMVTCRHIRVGEHNYNLVVILDVTEKNRMARMMIQSEKMLSVGGLAAGIAHEINNPLAGVLQNVELLQSRLLEDSAKNRAAAQKANVSLDGIARYIRERRIDQILFSIADAGSRGAQIVRNMLSFARKESDDPQWVELTELLDRTLLLAASDFDIHSQFDFRKIQIIREYAKSSGAIRCYPGKIQQVLLNILKNGADAMRGKQYIDSEPRFILRRFRTDQWEVIQIEDNGPGMEKAVQKRVFEPFFTTKEVGQGTGLGLSVSYFIITQDHKGQLEIDSDPGKYSRFTIKLPIKKTAR